MIRQSVTAAILFILIPIIILAGEKPDTAVFIQITDTHLCNLNSYHPLFINKRKHFGEGFEPLINFFRSVPKKLQANFIVITGDMIDYYEAETVTGEMLDTQIEQFVKYMEYSNVPVYMALGNHDIASYGVNSGSIRSDQFNAERARACWVRNVACFRNGTYYSRILQVDTTTYRLIFLDNAYYLPGRSREDTPYIIDRMQLFWLENELNKSDNDVELIFMHIPLLGGVGVDVNKNGQILETESLDPDCDLFGVLEKNQSARIIFSGHKHRNVIYEYKFSDDYSLTYVETGAFGYDKENWRSIKLTGESIIISCPGKDKKEYILNLNNN